MSAEQRVRLVHPTVVGAEPQETARVRRVVEELGLDHHFESVAAACCTHHMLGVAATSDRC